MSAISAPLTPVASRHKAAPTSEVAAQATSHLVVTKDQSKNRAVVAIAPIQQSRNARVAELAPMLGDSKAKTSLAHAEELLGA